MPLPMPAPAITSPMPIPNAMSVPVDGVPASAPSTPGAVFDAELDLVDAALGRAVVLDTRETPLEVVPDGAVLETLSEVIAPLGALPTVSEVVCVLEHVVRMGRSGRCTVVTMAGTVTVHVLPTGSGTSDWLPASLKGVETVGGPPTVASHMIAEPPPMSPIAAARPDTRAANRPRRRVARVCGGSPTRRSLKSLSLTLRSGIPRYASGYGATVPHLRPARRCKQKEPCHREASVVARLGERAA